MNIIKPSFNILHQEPTLNGVFKQIEIAGRTCYKSEDKITKTSATEFAERMIKSGHGAMLEHGTVYLHFKYDIRTSINIPYSEYAYFIQKYRKNKHSVIKEYLLNDLDINGIKDIYVTTNYRVLVENKWVNDLRYICEPTSFHEKRMSVKFVCDRGVSHEFVRHRVFSFAQESTRYCNYSKEKFDKEITFIIPCWLDLQEGKYWQDDELKIQNENKVFLPEMDLCLWSFLNQMLDIEDMYMMLTNENSSKFANTHKKWTPQQARSILPNALKTELVMTGFISDWKHFFSLRDHQAAHPQARELAQPLHEEFKILKLI